VVTGNPGSFFRVNLVHLAAHARAPLDAVKHEEFRLRTEQGGVGDAGGLQVFLGAHTDGARVTVVALHGGRLDDVAAHDHGADIGERVHYRRGVIRHQDHVGLVDVLPASNGGAIEHLAV